MSKRVKCYFCKKPIHISKFAGAFGLGDGDTYLFCSNIVCLIEYVDLRKKEDE